MVDSIAQKYIHNHITAEDKKTLLTLMSSPFNTLKDAYEHANLIDDDKRALEDIHAILSTGLKQAITTQYQLVSNEFSRLEDLHKLFFLPESYLGEQISLYHDKLLQVPGLSEKLPTLLDKVVPSIPRGSLQKTISEAIPIILKSDLEEEQKEALCNALSGDNAENIRNYFRAKEYSKVQYLKELSNCYAAAVGLKKSAPQLKALVPDEDFQIDQERLYRLKVGISTMAGVFLKANPRLKYEEGDLDPHFIEKAKAIAVSYCPPDPVRDELKIEIARLKVQLDAANVARQRQDNVLKETQKFLADLESSYVKEEDDSQEARATIVAELSQLKDNDKPSQDLITQKLLPATEAYLIELLKKAKPYSGTISIENLGATLPDLENNNYKKIEKKVTLLQELRTILTDDTKPCRQRVVSFQQRFDAIVKDKQNSFETHRDPAWLRYLRTCAILLGTFFGLGLIPYALATKQSLTFFTESKGKRFQDQCQQMLATTSNAA